jgi:YD repeat-containing protein
VLETYNSDGQLTSIADHTGLATTLHYDANTHLATVMNPLGRNLNFVYQDSLVRFVIAADGAVYQYEYEASRLVKVTYPNRQFRRYLYENRQNSHVITGIVDGKGKRVAINDLPSRSPKGLADTIPLPVPIKVLVKTTGMVCQAINCGQLLANIVQTVTDIATKEIELCKSEENTCPAKAPYGPYYRYEIDPKYVAQAYSTGWLYGTTPQGGAWPAAQTYKKDIKPLANNRLKFCTTVKPAGGTGPLWAYWYAITPGVIIHDDNTVKIPIVPVI